MAQNGSAEKSEDKKPVGEIEASVESQSFEKLVRDSVSNSIDGQEMSEDEFKELVNSLKESVLETLSDNSDRLLSLKETMSDYEWNKLLHEETKKILELNLHNAMQKRQEAEMFGKMAQESGEIKNEIASISEDFAKFSEAEKRRREEEKAEKEALLKRIAELEAENAEKDAKIEEQAKEIEQLKELAMMDALCKIPNRRATFMRVEDEIARARRQERDKNGKHSPLSVLFVDLDYFKRINDTHGHPVGDLALQEVAKRLNDSVGRETDFVGRVGGEEFVVVLPGTAGDSAEKNIASRILTKINETPLVVTDENGEEIEIPLTASIGVAELQNGWDDSEKLIKRADDCMYIAKNTGRNQVFYLDGPEDIKAKKEEIERLKSEKKVA